MVVGKLYAIRHFYEVQTSKESGFARAERGSSTRTCLFGMIVASDACDATRKYSISAENRCKSDVKSFRG